MHWTHSFLNKSLMLREKKDIKCEKLSVGMRGNMLPISVNWLKEPPWLTTVVLDCWNHLRRFKKYQCLSPIPKDSDRIGLQGPKAILTCSQDWFRTVALKLWSSDQWHHHNQRTVKMQIFRPHRRSKNQKLRGWKQPFCFNKPSRWF